MSIAKDRFRVRQPLRKLSMEVNMKYFPTIYQIVEAKYKNINVNLIFYLLFKKRIYL